MNTKMDGFRGNWYYNQPSGDEYVYKSARHGDVLRQAHPVRVVCAETNRTFSATAARTPTTARSSTWFHTSTIRPPRAKPTCVLDKRTDDAHDNPVINLDDQATSGSFPAVTVPRAPRIFRGASDRMTSINSN
jgi:hypothetical protein